MRGFGPGSRLMLDGITRLLPCSAQDAARFQELGFPSARMTTTGNIKLDVAIAALSAAERDGLRRELGLPAGLVAGFRHSGVAAPFAPWQPLQCVL